MSSDNQHSVQHEQQGIANNNTQNMMNTNLPENGPIMEDKMKDIVPQEQETQSQSSGHDIDEFEMEHMSNIPDEMLIPEDMHEDEDEHDEHAASITSDIDYSKLSKEELVATAARLFNERAIEQLKADFDAIKIHFYKIVKADQEKIKRQFLEQGGILEDFKAEPDILETRLKAIYTQYREKKSAYIQNLESEKLHNLNLKKAVIDEIKDLSNSAESVNDTFNQFRELQKKWRSIGPVPQSEVNNLWENYNHHVEKFYDYVKINKELRDLDFKRNHEAKLELCEKTEELLLEPSIVKAFRLLQEYHTKWREIGPVPFEMRAEIWNRFKDITSKINKKHQEHFDNQKALQDKNLEDKTKLCEEAEALIAIENNSVKDWEDRSKTLLEIQEKWKTIGFAPKKDNNRIYKRFRNACDAFFAKKRDFYKALKDQQTNNLQLKLDLCVQAETLKDSNEWKKTTDDMLQLQKKWKEIGPVPRKMSDVVWKRFRAACDVFFNNKAAHFSTIDNKYAENLTLKQALITEIENYSPVESAEENFEQLKAFQRRWAEIGFVPMQNKEETQTRYRKAIDKLFETLKVEKSKVNMLNYKNKIENLSHNRHSEKKIDKERDKLIMHVKKLESDIVQYENNIGFFSKSKGAQILVAEVQKKIDDAKAEMKALEEKIKMIDSL